MRNFTGTKIHQTVEMSVLFGCISWGMTRREAVEMAKDAIEAWIITALRFGDKIPAIDDCFLQYAIDELEDVEITSGETEGSYSKTSEGRCFEKQGFLPWNGKRFDED